MRLSEQQLARVTFGALASDKQADGLQLYRFPTEYIEAWGRQAPVLGERAKATAGIRLDFHTDSHTLTLQNFRGGRFELYLNGEAHAIIHSPEVHDFVLYDDAAQAHDTRVTLYFPAHSAGIMGEITLCEGATLVPHTYAQKILFIGDSITQGWQAEHDPLSYAMRISRALDADFVLQGIGGTYYCRECTGRMPFDPDTVIVAYGTNDCTKRKSFEELAKEVCSCLTFLAEAYAGKRIVVISPIWRCDSARLSVPLDDCRDLICREAGRLGLEYVNGLDLVPHDPSLFTDGLHPNDEGFAAYSERLLVHLR